MNLIKKTSVILCIFFAFSGCTQKTKLSLTIPEQTDYSGAVDFSLQSLTDTKADDERIIKKSSSDCDYYFFSQEQCSKLQIFSAMQGNSAVLIHFEVKDGQSKKENAQSLLSFLYKTDLKNKTSVLSPLTLRPAVSLNFADFKGESFYVLFSIARGEDSPCGFFIQKNNSLKYSISSIELVPAAVGFDFADNKQFYAFAPNGGALIKNSKKIDFSGLSLCFPSFNSENAQMPQLKIKSSALAAVNFTIGGEKISVRNGGQKFLSIPVASLKSPFSDFQITSNEAELETVLAVPSDKILLQTSPEFEGCPVQPIKTDPGLIMNWPRRNWRNSDYELFEWDRFEGILFFDTADYEVQNEFFRRLAFFVEKQGYRGKLLTDAQLKGQHGYNAHDYRAYDLARFFEHARLQNFPLNKKELLLQKILLVNGVIKTDENGSFIEGQGAVISISQESPSYLRTTFVAHEGWHGIFFVDKDFRDTVASIYYSLQSTDPRALDFLFRYFQVTPSLNYDTSDTYLMQNEFMAYMLQRPVSACEKYFTDMAARTHAQTFIKEEADYILETKAESFVGASQMLEDYVSSRWNLAAGRVWLLSR